MTRLRAKDMRSSHWQEIAICSPPKLQRSFIQLYLLRVCGSQNLKSPLTKYAFNHIARNSSTSNPVHAYALNHDDYIASLCKEPGHKIGTYPLIHSKPLCSPSVLSSGSPSSNPISPLTDRDLEPPFDFHFLAH